MGLEHCEELSLFGKKHWREREREINEHLVYWKVIKTVLVTINLFRVNNELIY